MRSDGPAPLPVFRSQHQAELLMWLLPHPDEEYGVTDLARRIGFPLSTLHREVARDDEAGLISNRTLDRGPQDQCRVAAYLDEQTARIDHSFAETERFIELPRERRSALITAALPGQTSVSKGSSVNPADRPCRDERAHRR